MRPHAPPCPETPALTLQFTLPGSSGLRSPVSEWDTAPLLRPRAWCQQSESGTSARAPNKAQTSAVTGSWHQAERAQGTVR